MEIFVLLFTIDNPEKAAAEAIAAKILIQGMRDGTFTGLESR